MGGCEQFVQGLLGPLGTSWGLLGDSPGGRLGFSVRAPPSRAFVSAAVGRLGPSWAPLAPSRGSLGPLLDSLGSLLGCLGSG